MRIEMTFNREVVGGISITRRADKEKTNIPVYLVEDLKVEHGYRRLSIARSLIHAARGYIEKQGEGTKKVWCYANTNTSDMFVEIMRLTPLPFHKDNFVEDDIAYVRHEGWL